MLVALATAQTSPSDYSNEEREDWELEEDGWTKENRRLPQPPFGIYFGRKDALEAHQK